MPELYTKIVDDEGNESYSAVSELPDEVIYEDPRYKQVTNRDINRRTRFNSLVASMEANGYVFERDDNGGVLTDEQGNVKMTKTPEVVDAPAPIPSVDEIYEVITQRQKQEQQKQAQAEHERNMAIQSAMEKHGLTGEVARKILADSNNPDEVASMLGREKLFFGETNGGQTEEELRLSEIEAMGLRLQKRMGKPTT